MKIAWAFTPLAFVAGMGLHWAVGRGIWFTVLASLFAAALAAAWARRQS